MKLTKTMFLTVLTVGSLMACGSVLAQNSTNTQSTSPVNVPPHMMLRGANIDGLAKFLNLTDAQKSQIQPIFEQQRQKMMGLRKDPTLSPDDRREQMKAIRENTMTQLQTILTPEQFQKYQSATQRRRRPMTPAPSNVPASTNAPAASSP